MPVPILAARNVHKTYGHGANRFDALKGVSLDISKGESIAIIGKSGSGKSTLMHLLALLDKPTEGVVELSGHDAATLSGSVLNRTRNSTFGFVFQQFFLNPAASVLDNVTLPLRIAGVSPAERRRRGLAALMQLELESKANNRATDLSGGQKQRVVIARALVNDPGVIFADEPTGNLDSRSSREVLGFLRQCVQDYGQSIVMVTHDPRAASFADRVLVLSDGSITQDMDHPTYDDILAVFAEHDDPDNGPVDVEPAAREA